MRTTKSIFYLITLLLCAGIPIVALVLWILAFKRAISELPIIYFIYLMVCPLVFTFFSFMFPIVRRVTINHFKRAEIQKEVEFDAKMQKFKVDQEVFNESFRLLTPQQQKEINDLRISRLKEKEETKQKKVEKESTELSRPKKEDGFSFF